MDPNTMTGVLIRMANFGHRDHILGSLMEDRHRGKKAM